MQMLCRQVSNYGELDPYNQMYADLILSPKIDDEKITQQLVNAVSALWDDRCVQAAFEHRDQFPLADSAQYFFDRINEVRSFSFRRSLSQPSLNSQIDSPEYIPSEQDALRSWCPTTGLVETDIVIDESHFRLIDVSGRRGERRKSV